MDLITILTLASAASNVIGAHVQGKSERERNRIATERANQQIGWQNEQLQWGKDDLEKQKEAAVGSLLTQSAALGIGGPSVDAAKGYTIGEYNRAMSQVDKQIGWNNQQLGWNKEDMNLFNQQSRFNQSVGIGSSLLTMGTNLYGNAENKKYKSLYEDAKKNYTNTFNSGGLGI